MFRVDKARVERAFQAYTGHFDTTNLQISNKIRHSHHVAANCEAVASALSADTDLAWLIGMLHDIGRFEQIRVVHGYDDHKGLDHGDYGAKMLFEEGLIRDFTDWTDADGVIRKAVRWHNKYELPEGLNEDERLYCQIVRDADKLDNFRGFLENDFFSFHEHTPEEVQGSEISDEIVDCFRRGDTIPFRLIRSAADFFLIPYALYLGLVYPASRDLAEEQGCYRRMLEFRFTDETNRRKFDQIREYVREAQARS